MVVDNNGIALDAFTVLAQSVEVGALRNQDYRSAKGRFTLDNSAPAEYARYLE